MRASSLCSSASSLRCSSSNLSSAPRSAASSTCPAKFPPIGQLVDLFQAGVDLQNGAHGGSQIHNAVKDQYPQQDNTQGVGQKADEQLYRGVQQLDHEQTGKTPGQGEFQTDIAAQVKGLVAVVPPALVKEFFQYKAGQPFQGGSDQHAPHKQQGEALTEGGQQAQHQNRPEAVNGAQRAVEKAPVDEFPRVQRREAHFHTPAQKGINEKEP